MISNFAFDAVFIEFWEVTMVIWCCRRKYWNLALSSVPCVVCSVCRNWYKNNKPGTKLAQNLYPPLFLLLLFFGIVKVLKFYLAQNCRDRKHICSFLIVNLLIGWAGSIKSEWSQFNLHSIWQINFSFFNRWNSFESPTPSARTTPVACYWVKERKDLNRMLRNVCGDVLA